MDGLFDALDRFGRSVVETVPGAEYDGADIDTRGGREWRVTFDVAGARFRLSVDRDGAWLFHDAGSIHYADGDWRALLVERFGGAK
jgi:hypothetical protein